MKKKLLSVLLVLALAAALFAALSVSASAYGGSVANSGLSWEIVDHKLTISGSGGMPDYDDWDETPWAYDEDDKCSYNTVTSIEVTDGVTSIGSNAFAYFYNVTSISIGQNVASIGDYAFYDATYKLGNASVDLVLPASLRTVGIEAFAYCYGIKNICIRSNNLQTNSRSFYCCTGLENLAIGSVDADAETEEKIYIGTECFEECENLKNVFLSRTLNKIDWDGFEECEALRNFYYGGTEMSFAQNVTVDMGDDGGNLYIVPKSNPIDDLCNENLTRFCRDDIFMMQPKTSGGGKYTATIRISNWVFSGAPFNFRDTELPLPEWSSGDAYVDENGQTQHLNKKFTVLSRNMTTLSDGWYVVADQLDFGGTQLQADGDVKLILLNGCGITTSGGVLVCNGKKLTIYSETLDTLSSNNNMGYIQVNGAPQYCAGIGTGELLNGICTADLIFCGGNIHVKSGGRLGAGIGSGDSGRTDCRLTICNGRFDGIYGGENSAGIGSGRCAGSTVLIKNGVFLNIQGGGDAAGIGSTFEGNSKVTITGGSFDGVYGGSESAGIGSGMQGDCTLTIEGGTFKNITAGWNCSNAVGAGTRARCTILKDTVGITNGGVSGFTLSEGNWWIIAVGAVVICGGIAAIIIASKKKKAKPAA